MARKRKKTVRIPKTFALVLAILFILTLIAGYFLWRKGYLNDYLPEHLHYGHEEEPEDIITGELSIHFMELGVWATGDSTLIKVGDTEVLIDAGATKSSIPTLTSYIERYCTDGVLEYVVATHAHEDHIGAFATEDGEGLLYTFEIGTVIYYTQKNTTSKVSGYFQTRVQELASQGTNVYTALECYTQTNGAKSTYYLNDEQTISLQILYQKYYEETSSKENNYSVCTLLSQGNNHYLFTGDLEEAGEKSLVENNDLPKCKLYKAGHHGSDTSSHDDLLSEIKPEIVCVCCCAGSTEYTKDVLKQFPSQAFIDRVAPYTDKIYVTTMATGEKGGFTSMNGDIVITSNGGELTVTCSNNDTILKDTDWFRTYRTWPQNGK